MEDGFKICDSGVNRRFASATDKSPQPSSTNVHYHNRQMSVHLQNKHLDISLLSPTPPINLYILYEHLSNGYGISVARDTHEKPFFSLEPFPPLADPHNARFTTQTPPGFAAPSASVPAGEKNGEKRNSGRPLPGNVRASQACRKVCRDARKKRLCL